MTNHKIILGDSRNLSKIADKSVQLIITSPPYWQLKDYGSDDQIGFNDSYEEYINNLNLVWKECYRVLSYRNHSFLRNLRNGLYGSHYMAKNHHNEYFWWWCCYG